MKYNPITHETNISPFLLIFYFLIFYTMTKKLTSQQQKALKSPKIRVIFESPNQPNRQQRRAEKNRRTSPSFLTKKWTE